MTRAVSLGYSGGMKTAQEEADQAARQLEADPLLQESTVRLVRNLLIIARDVGGRARAVHNGFVARFDHHQQEDDFLRTARMEYPGVDSKMRRKALPRGRVELALSPRDALAYEAEATEAWTMGPGAEAARTLEQRPGGPKPRPPASPRKKARKPASRKNAYYTVHTTDGRFEWLGRASSANAAKRAHLAELGYTTKAEIDEHAPDLIASKVKPLTLYDYETAEPIRKLNRSETLAYWESMDGSNYAGAVDGSAFGYEGTVYAQ